MSFVLASITKGSLNGITDYLHMCKDKTAILQRFSDQPNIALIPLIVRKSLLMNEKSPRWKDHFSEFEDFEMLS